MAEERRYVNVLFDETVLQKLDDFRFRHRFPSRTEAIRWLVGWALNEKPVPTADYWEQLRHGTGEAEQRGRDVAARKKIAKK